MFGDWPFDWYWFDPPCPQRYYSHKEISGVPVRIHIENLELCDSNHKIPEKTVFFDDGSTLMILNGKHYGSQARNEEFDEEKAVLMCLARANGYTYGDIKRIVANAVHTKKKKEK